MNILHLNAYFVQTIPEIARKMGACNFTIGSTHLVQVTHINHPHSFYVRLSCLRFAVKLLENRGPPITFAQLTTGKDVVYESRAVGHHVRGRIQKIDVCERGLGIVCTILAIDYGCVDKHVFVKQIFLPGKESKMCPPLALHCQLNTCEPKDDVFDSEAIHAMNFFVGNYTSKIIIRFRTSETFKVDLRALQCPDDIATILALLSFTQFFRNTITDVVAKPRPTRYIHRELKTGDKLHVRVQNGTSALGFYAAEIEEYKHYDNVLEWYRFTRYCMNQPALDVEAAVDGRTCAVKVLNPVRFERAIVLRVTVPNTKAMVLLVDWGKQIEANFEDIKPVGITFNKCPPMALYCTAEAKNSLNYVFGLRMLYPGLEFLIEVLQPGNGFRLPHRVKLCAAFPPTTIAGEFTKKD